MATLSTGTAVPPEWPLATDTVTDSELRARHGTHETTETGPPMPTPPPVGKQPLDKVATATVTVSELDEPLEVIGSTNIYDEHGKIRLIPSPSPDPRDPLNLPNWRKYAAIGALCFFGSLSMSADFVVGGLLPVFLLEYSGVDPRPILKTADLKGNPSPLAIIPPGVVPISLYQVTLLQTLPSLSNCVASYFLVPLSLAIGRRPVLLVTAMCSWVGGFWAGYSTSLQGHLAARVVHGLGSATVEGLLPLIMQDMVFIHQRNRSIAAILACQGPVMTIFGIVSPYIAVHYSWRWLYWVTSYAGILAWLLLIAFVPETRRMRTKQELNGQSLWPIPQGKDRPDLDYARYKGRTWKDNLGMFNCGFEWKETGIQMLRTLQSTYFPAIVIVILLDGVFFIILHSVGQTISFALLAAGIPYELSGLHVLTHVVSSAVVYVFGGVVADKLTLKVSRMRGSTGREPEYQLPNLVVPFLSAMIGCAVFGAAQHFHLHVAILLLGSLFLSIGTMTSFTILKTFTIESYPHWPGPVLVNVSTFRTLISFAFSSHAATWVQERGPLVIFGIYIAVLFVVSGFIPVLFFYGKQFRQWTGGKVAKSEALVHTHSSETVSTEEKSLNHVVSVESVGSFDKSVDKVTSVETVESIQTRMEKRSSKSSL